MVVVFFSRAGENYEVGEVTVGNTAKLAQEVARRTDSPMIEITRTEPYPERYAATSEMVQEEQRVNARPLFTLSGDVDALDAEVLWPEGYVIGDDARDDLVLGVLEDEARDPARVTVGVRVRRTVEAGTARELDGSLVGRNQACKHLSE